MSMRVIIIRRAPTAMKKNVYRTAPIDKKDAATVIWTDQHMWGTYEPTRDAYSDACGVSSSEASQGTNHGRAGTNVNATRLSTHFYR